MQAAKTLLKRDRSPKRHNSTSVPGITDSPAFSAKATSPSADEAKSRKDKLGDGIQKAAKAVAHPRQTAKQHATSKLLANERPYLEDQASADQTWLDAHDQLDSVNAKLRDQSLDADPSGAEPPPQPPYDELKDGANRQQQTLEDVEEERRALHAGWHMSRYVRRARVVQKGALAFPSKRLYEERDAEGQYIGTKWGHWIGHVRCQSYLYSMHSNETLTHCSADLLVNARLLDALH